MRCECVRTYSTAVSSHSSLTTGDSSGCRCHIYSVYTIWWMLYLRVSSLLFDVDYWDERCVRAHTYIHCMRGCGWICIVYIRIDQFCTTNDFDLKFFRSVFWLCIQFSKSKGIWQKIEIHSVPNDDEIQSSLLLRLRSLVTCTTITVNIQITSSKLFTKTLASMMGWHLPLTSTFYIWMTIRYFCSRE